MTSLKASQDLIDLFYPIGTYYETSDPNFNPNIIWGGTWIQDTKGQTLVSKSDSGIFELLDGEYGQTSVSLNHSHEAGDNLTACIGSPSGNANALGFAAMNSAGPDSTYSVGNNSSAFTNGHPGRSHNTRIVGSTKEALSFIWTVQPSKVCIRWHRTA